MRQELFLGASLVLCVMMLKTISASPVPEEEAQTTASQDLAETTVSPPTEKTYLYCYGCASSSNEFCGEVPDMSIMQYYKEPCNGQCVFYRNTTHTGRGCSWTFGLMGKQETNGILIFNSLQFTFCDTQLCNLMAGNL